MCPGYDQSLRPRRSGSRRSSKSWEAAVGNPFAGDGGGHGGDSAGQDDNPGGGEDEEEEEEEGGGGDLDDDDREGELADVLGRCSRRSSYGSSYFYDRQLYLHSYQFRRKLSVCDRLRGSIKRIKAAAWSLVSCKYGDQCHHHRHSARKFCKRLSGAVSSISLKPRCVQLPPD